MARQSIDHRDFHRKGEKPKRKPGLQRKPGVGEQWWTQDPDDAAQGISSNLTFWAQNQRARLRQLARYARFYGNMSAMGYAASSLALQSQLAAQFGENVTLNVSGSVTDTLVSKTCRNKPKPYFLTDNGDRKAQRIAKNRNVFLTGIFQENQTYAKTRIAFRDAVVWGDGLIYVHAVNGRVTHTRVTPGELFVDEVEALANGGMPRQLHRVLFVDRDALLEEYPKKASIIEDSSWTDGNLYAQVPSLADLVCVRESWHLPSGEESEDGAYVKTVGRGALTDVVPWTRPTYPFARMTYCPRMYGWWGQGLIEQGQSLQLEINKTAWTIQEGMHRMGTTKIWTGPGGNLSPDQVTNDTTAILESAQEPKYLSPPPVQEEYFAYQEALINRYYNLAGVSQPDATSTKPKGEVSGLALELIHDIGTERFMSVGQAFEEFHCEIGRQSILTASDIVDAAKEAAKKDEKPPRYEVKATLKGTAKVVDFEDLEFKPDESFSIQCFPISALPSDPAGRTEKVQTYAQAGWISQDTARELVDFPDVGWVEGLHNARREFVTQKLDAMIDRGEAYTIEEGYDEPAVFLELASEYYQRFRLDKAGVSEANLDLVRQTIDAAKALIAKTQAAQVAAAQPPAPAVPAPAPVSQLLPNVRQAA